MIFKSLFINKIVKGCNWKIFYGEVYILVCG